MPDQMELSPTFLEIAACPACHSKFAVDMLLTGYAAAHGLGATSLRYFNVGGARGAFGERHAIETHLIPNLLKVPAGQRDRAAVFGTDYATKDGTAVRDYLHVVDLGRAHLLALETSEPGRHRIFNLGSGNGYSVKEVLDACREAGHVWLGDETALAGDAEGHVQGAGAVRIEGRALFPHPSGDLFVVRVVG